jgi:hypothetical protein
MSKVDNSFKKGLEKYLKAAFDGLNYDINDYLINNYRVLVELIGTNYLTIRVDTFDINKNGKQVTTNDKYTIENMIDVILMPVNILIDMRDLGMELKNIFFVCFDVIDNNLFLTSFGDETLVQELPIKEDIECGK